MDWKAQKKACILIFAYLFFLLEVEGFLFGGDLSQSRLFRCLTDSKNVDCHSRQNRICCNLLKRKSSRLQSARQFPHFPARDLIQAEELKPDQDFKSDQVPNTDYEDIITKDNSDLNFRAKDFPIIKVDSSFSFEPNDRSKKEFSRVEDNIVDVEEKLEEKIGGDFDGEDQICKTLEVSCHVIPNHPCCKRQKAEIVIGKPIAQIEKLFDFSKIHLARSTPPPNGTNMPGKKVIANEFQEFDPKCSSLKFSCRLAPKQPCCIRSNENSISSTKADIGHTPPPRRTFFRPMTDTKFDFNNETEVFLKSEDSLENQDPNLYDDQLEINHQASDLNEEESDQESDLNEKNNSQKQQMETIKKDVKNHEVVNDESELVSEVVHFPKDKKSETDIIRIEMEDHDFEMCRTLNVPCHAIPNHPCCNQEHTRNTNPFTFLTGDDELPNKFSTASKVSETTLPPWNSQDQRKHELRMCSVLSISCQTNPDHSCCQNSNEQISVEGNSEKQEEEYEDDEPDFNFSKIAMTLKTAKPSQMNTMALPQTPESMLEDKIRIINPAQKHYQRACKGLQIDCVDQPTHTCCKYGSLNEKEVLPVSIHSKENNFDEGQPFDFSRIVNFKTTTSGIPFPSTERPDHEKSLERSEDDLEREPQQVDQPTKFLGGQRRAMKPLKGQNSTSTQAESSETQLGSNQGDKTIDEETFGAAAIDDKTIVDEAIGEKGYDRGMCAILKVPCRFVSDHPCCDFEMPIDLVARARSMDGSADLKWRKLKTLGPQARSIDSNFADDETRPRNANLVNLKIEYNHATSKSSVSIPQYHFDGGPEVTSTILGVCWRLVQLRCPPPPMPSSDSHPDSALTLKPEKIHPCCQLNRKPGLDTTGDSRISKWLSVSSTNDSEVIKTV